MLERLRRQYAELAATATALRERLAASDGPLSAEDSEEITRLSAEMTSVRGQIDQLDQLEGAIVRNEAGQETWAEVAGSGVPVVDESVTDPFPLSRLARAAAGGGLPPPITVRPELVARERRFLNAGMTARDIVEAYQRGHAFTIDDETQQIRVLSVGTDTAGGYLVPTITDRNLYDAREFVGGVRMAGATVVTTETGAEMDFPKVTTHFAVTGTLETAEGDAATATEDTMGQTAVPTYEYTALAEVTNQLLMDNVVDLESYLAKMLGRVMAKKTEMRYHHGTGASMPKGIMNSPPAGQTITSNTTLVVKFVDLKMLFQLDAEYITDFDMVRWLMGSQTYGEFVFLVDSQGRPILPQVPSAMPGRRLLEAPAIFSSFISTGLAASSYPVVVGNFEDAYIIRDVSGTTITASAHAEFKKRLVVFQAAGRHGGNIQDPEAVRFLKIKA